eukprot:4505070-Alexandrium_andersonii.AAC.1
MLKVREAERPELPPPMVRLKRIWELSIAGHAGTLQQCRLCSSAVKRNADVAQCPLCLLPFHPECCHALVQHVMRDNRATGESRRTLPQRRGFALPDAMANSAGTCHMCLGLWK